MTYRALCGRLLEISGSLVLAAEQFEALDASICQQLLEHAQALQSLSLAANGNVRRDPLPLAQARVMAFLRQFLFDHKIPPTRAEAGIQIAQCCTRTSEFAAEKVTDHIASGHGQRYQTGHVQAGINARVWINMFGLHNKGNGP